MTSSNPSPFEARPRTLSLTYLKFSKIPDVWKMLKNGTISRDSEHIKDAELQQKTVKLPPWNMKARLIAGVIGMVASVAFIFGLKRGTAALEGLRS